MQLLILILIIALLVGAVGSFPAWPHSQGWGYAPFSGLGLLLVIVLVLVILGRV